MAVTQDVKNPYGIVQAGALLWLADVTASILILENGDRAADGSGFPLAVNLHCSFIGNVKEGEVKARASFVRNGNRLKVVRTVITGNDNHILAEITTTHLGA